MRQSFGHCIIGIGLVFGLICTSAAAWEPEDFSDYVRPESYCQTVATKYPTDFNNIALVAGSSMDTMQLPSGMRLKVLAETATQYYISLGGKTGFIERETAECLDFRQEALEPACDRTPPNQWPVLYHLIHFAPFGTKLWGSMGETSQGIEIYAPYDTAVLAAGAGKVVYVGPIHGNYIGMGSGPYGLILDHGNSIYSVYYHNSATLVRRGDCVAQGQKIARLGWYGDVNNPMGIEDFEIKPIARLSFYIVHSEKLVGLWYAPFDPKTKTFIDPMSLLQLPRFDNLVLYRTETGEITLEKPE